MVHVITLPEISGVADTLASKIICIGERNRCHIGGNYAITVVIMKPEN